MSARMWTNDDDERWQSFEGETASASSESIQSKVLFRDVFRGSLAYFLTALRYRLLLAALPNKSLSMEINEERDRREFAEWIAVPIPDPPGLEAIDA